MSEWQAIIDTGIKFILPKLISSALDAASKTFRGLSPYHTLDFKNHLEAAYARCTKIKTIVNGDKPINLLENYVNPNFKQRSLNYDELKFIERIWLDRKIALKGAAGAGKSMFMRYFWVCCSVQPRGKIPIFIELRRFNEITDDDFTTFVFHTAVSSSKQEARPLFSRAIEEGQFIFIFDGFDELKEERRRNVETAVLKLSEYNNIIVVSGRPDDIFNSWQEFSVYEMMPLSLKQTTRLINMLDFDNTVKKKFVRRLKSDLYEKHQSFASRPLLATMMLLTFNAYADVPEKIHVFYDQAFDTLFLRHDATKEAFTREKKTNYPIDVFKRLLSLFCLITYNEDKLEFSETEILETLGKVSTLEGVQIKKREFLHDLLDSVCILQKDGLNIIFSHRSFQEYFCAYSIARLPEIKVPGLITRFAGRQSDSVIQMLYDMDKHLVNRIYLLPQLQNYEQATREVSKPFDVVSFLTALSVEVQITQLSYTKMEADFFVILGPPENDFLCLRAVVMQIYPNILSDKLRRKFLRPNIFVNVDSYDKFNELIAPYIECNRNDDHDEFVLRTDFKKIKYSSRNTRSNGIDASVGSDELQRKVVEWLTSSNLSSHIENEHDKIISLFERVKGEQTRQSTTMDDILGV